MLLRIAGWVPDALVTRARAGLASGLTAEVAETVGYAVIAYGLPLTGDDRRLLATVLSEAGRDPGPVGRAGSGTRFGTPCVRWATAPASGTDDHLTRAVLREVSTEEVRAVWRAWRSPGRPTLYPEPTPVFLIQSGRAAADLPHLTAMVQECLQHEGQPDPQVEVFREERQLTGYHRAALAVAELLWSGRGTDPVPVARVFAPVAATGGPGHASAATLDGAERDRILSYLDSGTVVVASTARLDDVVDPGRHAVVPTGFRTDGSWVWCDATAYYLRRHGVVPEPALRQHVARHQASVAPAADLVDVHRALASLRAMSGG